jgi:uncharacterized membrane protein
MLKLFSKIVGHMQLKLFFLSLYLFYHKMKISNKKKMKHTHTFSFYYILLTHPTIIFLQIIKIQNNSNTHTLNIYNL